MSLEYNSGIKLVLQKAICQSDPERSTSKTEMKSKYEAKLSRAPVNKTDINNVFCGYFRNAAICYLNQRNHRENLNNVQKQKMYNTENS